MQRIIITADQTMIRSSQQRAGKKAAETVVQRKAMDHVIWRSECESVEENGRFPLPRQSMDLLSISDQMAEKGN